MNLERARKYVAGHFTGTRYEHLIDETVAELLRRADHLPLPEFYTMAASVVLQTMHRERDQQRQTDARMASA